MTGIIERIARAICGVHETQPDVFMQTVNGVTDKLIWEHYIPEALAAYDSMNQNQPPDAKMSEWQPIEKAPKLCGKNYGIKIIAYPTTKGNRRNSFREVGVAKCLTGRNFNSICIPEASDDEFCWKNDNQRPIKPTHWMPLPQPPEPSK